MSNKQGNSIEHYQKKATDMSSRNKELETKLDSSYHTFSQLIIRLSTTCKGFDLELDTKLAKLRSGLQKNKDLDNLSPLIDDVNQRLNSYAKILDNSRTKAQAKILEAGKKLQTKKGLPERTRRNLRALLTHVEVSNETVNDMFPKIGQLVDLYEQALAAKLEIPKNALSDTAQSQDPKISKIANQVMNLLSELAFSDDAGQTKEEIQATLLETDNPEQVLQCCIDIIKLIVGSVTKERKAAQEFLFSLNDALSSVHQALDDTYQKNSASSSKNKAIGIQLQKQVEKMSSDVADATSLDSLKLQIQEHLTQIASSLTEKQQLEQSEQLVLLETMNNMQEQLTTLEKEAERYRERLAEQQFKSLQDSLTQLPNRAAFDERLELEYKRFKRHHHSLCIAIADIDLFKSVNDNFGHTVGDKTLQVVSRVLRKSIRETDFIARYGGEEFVLLFGDTKIAQAERILQKLREAVQKIPFKFKDSDVSITISAGVTQFTSKDTSREAFDRADEALYEAKKTGRNKVIVK